MGIVRNTELEAMVGDPDDHRPNTAWRVVVDSGAVRVANLSFLEERCAVGDRIPLHRHDVDEVVVVIAGTASYSLDGDEHHVSSGDVIFIPAGAEHGTANVGDEVLHVHAVFAARSVLMEMIGRNPAPGTEDDPPMTTRYDFATGEVDVIGPTRR